MNQLLSRWRMPALTMMAVCAAILATVALLRVSTVRSVPVINVRWAERVSDDERSKTERELSLVFHAPKGSRTGSYFLLDTSRANIERLVGHRFIEDTAFVSRSVFVLEGAPTAQFWLGDRWTVLRSRGLLNALFAGMIPGALLLLLTPTRKVVVAASSILDRVPTVSPQALKILDITLLCVVLAMALREGLRVSAGVSVPPDPDLLRDAAQARAIADGMWGDPYFSGERIWYNPLVPSIVAFLSKVTHVSVLVVYARAGAVLNLLGPVAFFALTASVLGLEASVAGTACLVFLAPRDLPGWAAASFSPWLFAGVFTQALFYTGLMAADRAARSRRLGSWMFAGVALGFTFLGHTAPALILGAVLVLLALGRMAAREEVQKLPPVRDVGLSLLIALVVSLPLTWSVAVHYRFATLNPAPAAWVFPPTIISNWRSLVDSFSGARGYLALAGILLLAASRTDRRRALVLWLWFSVVALLLATYYASPWLARVGLRVPSILPAFHFVFYAGAALAVLQGYAIWRIARGLARFLASGRVAHGLMLSHLFLAGAVLWCAVVMLPQLRQREDFVDVPRRGKNYAHIAGFNSTREWIDRTTRPGTVFLAADFVGLSVVGPAGGRVVALENLYANPYVRVDDRERARNDMMKAIQAESRDTFCGLADTYHVEYVIGSTADPVRPPSFLSLVHSDEGLNVWAVKGCSTS